jgi:hypothetical protein
MMSRLQKFNLIFSLLVVISGICTAQSSELKILPLGNSLTYGWFDGSETDGDRISYRYQLYNLLNAAGYDFDFVGHAYTGYSVFPDAENGGIPGIKDEQLADVMTYGYYWKYGQKINIVSPNQPYLNAYPADIILLHIGTNDWINEEIYGYQVAVLNQLFDAIDTYETTYLKEVLVIVARIINKKNAFSVCEGPLSEWKVEYYNDELEALVNTRIAAGDKIKLIDMQCGADIDYTDDMLNDYHPTQIGYDKMGTHWFEEIDNINAAPVISNITITPVNEGQSFAPITLDNYVTDDYTSDANIVWTVSPEPVHYDVTINSQRIATVSPKDPEWSGTEVITFVATDNGHYIQKLKKSSAKDVTFTTLYVNDPPVIISQITSFNLNEDTSFDLVLDDLEIVDDNDPSDWTLNILPGPDYSVDGNTITPAQDFNGELHVTVTVSDDIQDSEEFTVIAYFNPVNDAPVINGGGPLNTNEDIGLEIKISDLDYYEPDNTIEELTLYVLIGTNYTVNGHTVQPATNFNGTLQVGVRLRDLSLFSNTYTIIVHVTAVNDPPVITSVPVSPAPDNQEYVYNVAAFDPDTDNISYVAPTKPLWLSINPATGELHGTPTIDDVGVHHVIVGAFDGTITTYQDFYLEITHLNNPPFFTNEPDTTADLDVTYMWRARADDNDGDDVIFLPLKIPYFLTFLSESGILTGTPVAENEGIHSVKIGATDGIDTTILDFLLYVGDPEGILEPVTYNDGFLTIYPNPANTYLTISLKKSVSKIEAIQIIDLMGRTVFIQGQTYLDPDQSVPIDISGISKGSYILIIHLPDRILSQKLIIN